MRNSKNWNAFGREFGKCLNDIEEDFKKLPRWQRMFFHREIRKAAREEDTRENQVMRQLAQKRKHNNNNKTPKPVKKPVATHMWAPRK